MVTAPIRLSRAFVLFVSLLGLAKRSFHITSSSPPVAIKHTLLTVFAMGTTSAVTLPVELLSAIVTFVAEGSEDDSRPMLLSLCLASRVLHELSIRHLYRHVPIRCSERSLEEKDLEHGKQPVIRSIRMCGALLRNKYSIREFVRVVTLEETPE